MDVVTGRTHVVVLGGGLVGGFIAKHGARDSQWHITLVDRDRELLDALQRKVLLSTNQADLTDRDVLRKCIEEADLVINALPGHIGFQALTWTLEAGVPAIDISFYPEDPLSLQELAETLDVTAVVDCGVMPGLGGMIAANFCTKLDTPEALKIMVGGIPQDRATAGPFEYKAPFSPSDVIEEYTRPARMRINGEVLTVPPMSDLERLTFNNVGELEAFNTDGLRTLLTSLDIPSMVEKTLRWPGHAEKIQFLRSLGFLGEEPVRIKGREVAPRDATAALLMQSWEIGPEDKELTVMSVEVEGVKDGRRVRHRCDVLDRTQADGTLSMARTTGWPALIAAKALLGGRIQGPGIIPAEKLGFDQPVFVEFLNGFMRAELPLMFSQRDLGAADEAPAEPLVKMPSVLWSEPGSGEEAQPEPSPEPARPRAAAVAAVSVEAQILESVTAVPAALDSAEPAEHTPASPEPEVPVGAAGEAEAAPQPAPEPTADEPPVASDTAPEDAPGAGQDMAQAPAVETVELETEPPTEVQATHVMADSAEASAPVIDSEAAAPPVQPAAELGPAPPQPVTTAPSAPQPASAAAPAGLLDPFAAEGGLEAWISASFDDEDHKPVSAEAAVTEDAEPVMAMTGDEQQAEADSLGEHEQEAAEPVEIEPVVEESDAVATEAVEPEVDEAEIEAGVEVEEVAAAEPEPVKKTFSLDEAFGPAPAASPSADEPVAVVPAFTPETGLSVAAVIPPEPVAAPEAQPAVHASQPEPPVPAEAAPPEPVDDGRWRASKVAAVKPGAFTPEALESQALEEIVDHSGLAARLSAVLEQATAGLPVPGQADDAAVQPEDDGPTMIVVETPGYAEGGLAEAVTQQVEPSANGTPNISVNGFGPPPEDDERPLNGEG